MAPLRTNLVNHFLACYSSSSSPSVATSHAKKSSRLSPFPEISPLKRTPEAPHGPARKHRIAFPQARPAKLTPPRPRSISTNKNTHPRASNITLSTSEGSDQERRALSPRKQRVAKAAPEQRQTPRAPGAPNGFSVAPVIISVPEPTDGWSCLAHIRAMSLSRRLPSATPAPVGASARPATQPSGVPIPSGPPVSAAVILQALRTPAPVQSGGTRPPETQTAPVAAASIGTAITGTAESASAAASETHLTARTCSTAYCKTRLPDIRAYPYKTCEHHRAVSKEWYRRNVKKNTGGAEKAGTGPPSQRRSPVSAFVLANTAHPRRTSATAMPAPALNVTKRTCSTAPCKTVLPPSNVYPYKTCERHREISRNKQRLRAERTASESQRASTRKRREDLGDMPQVEHTSGRECDGELGNGMTKGWYVDATFSWKKGIIAVGAAPPSITGMELASRLKACGEVL